MPATYPEPARQTPVTEHADVVVCGGGPAGVAAALYAARAGASVRLIETHGCLGGIWTAGALAWILDWANKPGLTKEIIDTLATRDACREPHWNGRAYDIEAMKLLLEEKCAHDGVRVRLHTRVVAAGRNDKNRLAVAITESKSGREAFPSDVFIDCTGDGDLAAAAGCGFGLGRPENGQCQPMSLMALLGGVKAADVKPFLHLSGIKYRDDSNAILAALKTVGVEPSYASPIIIRIHEDLFAMMANHQYGVSALDAQQITDATLKARAEVNTIVEGLRKLGGPWASVKLVATASQIGVREGRRIRGLYEVVEKDLREGARHDDAVCRVTFGVDVHSTDPKKGKAFSTENRDKGKPYDIPLRALIAREVDGLLMAGRCISGDFIAHSSYRVTGNSVAMGQAAGVAAALASKAGVRPQDVPFKDIKARLEQLIGGPAIAENAPVKNGRDR